MDIVYIVRPGDENEELRYSLRSLQNIPHDRVWISGYCPVWVRNVERIECNVLGDKQVKAAANLAAAAQHPEVSDPFLMFNDDMFVMQPLSQIPVWHEGSMRRSLEQYPFSAYGKAMRATYEKLLQLGVENPIGYALHIPMQFDKTALLLAMSLGKGIKGLHIRSMYGNLNGVEGVESADVKVYRGHKGHDYRGWPLLSTSDRTFKYHPAGRYVRESFPNPSPYEFNRDRDRPRLVRRSSALVSTTH